jgi:hypothetical protein
LSLVFQGLYVEKARLGRIIALLEQLQQEGDNQGPPPLTQVRGLERISARERRVAELIRAYWETRRF